MILIQLVQSLILAIYLGVTRPHFFLLLIDFALLIGYLDTRLLTILQIGSIVLYTEILEHSQVFTFLICARLFEGCGQINQKEKLFFIIPSTTYVFARMGIFDEPEIYLALFGTLALFTWQFMRNTPNDIQKLFNLLQICIPSSICIIQDEQFRFTTEKFKQEYPFLTPDNIANLATQSTKESLDTYIKRLKNQNGQPYEFINQRILSQCQFEHSQAIEQDRFPIDITVIEVLWEYRPALVLCFQSQQEKELNSQLTELQLQDSYKDDLLASVSHDFKTPIYGMVTIVQYLEEQTEDEGEQYYLRIIRKNAYLLLFMINDILDWARIRKNQLRLCNSTFHIQDIVDEIIELMSLQAEKKGIQVRSHFSVSSGLMFSDPNRIKQILLNLISNSLKFTEKGTIDIHVSQNLSLQISKPILQVTVKDTGVGIPDHIKPRLFQMYGTFDNTNGLNKHGTGLGLVICKKLVGLLGPTDSIELDSHLGIGSSFTFQLYLNNDSASDQKSQQEYLNIVKQEHSMSLQPQSAGFSYQSMHNHQKQKINITSQVLIFKTKKKEELKHDLIKMNKISFTQYDLPVKKASRLRKQSSDQFQDEVSEGALRKNSVATFGKNPSQRSQSPRKIKLTEESLVQENYVTAATHTDDETTQFMQQLLPEKTLFLVVDDQPTNIFAFHLILRKFTNLQIDEAYNGEQAITKVKEKIDQGLNYKYIFMDLTMPILDGYTTTERLRMMEKNNQKERSYIIALSGYDDSKEKEQCYKSGFDAFITKPMKITDVISVFKEIKQK
ncbi:hypothetical protein pb186bvf_018373 [Paramecium bursaria]